jgi:hypothetical protein
MTINFISLPLESQALLMLDLGLRCEAREHLRHVLHAPIKGYQLNNARMHL